MAFHDFSKMISRHKRSLQLAHKLGAVRDPDTTKMTDQGWDTPVNIEGALWFVTYKDLKRYENFELTISDMKLITSPSLLNGFIPEIKDKLETEGNIYYIKKIVKQDYYGNFQVLFLTKEYDQI